MFLLPWPDILWCEVNSPSYGLQGGLSMFRQLFSCRGRVWDRQAYAGHGDSVHILALQGEGSVPREDEPVIILYDQHLGEESLAVFRDTALFQGYPQLVVSATIGIKKT